MASEASLSPESLDELRSRFVGELLPPAHARYDEVRQVHNGAIDRRPALVARCRGTADVRDALAFARDAGLEVSVRGGGHNVAGRAVLDDGVMIDLSPMKGVHVDPERRLVRAEAGLTWGELNREMQVFGLATTGGVVSSTGIAGLTLGGGVGFLMGKHGLTVDNLLSAEVVLADGRVVTASEESEPDLFWGLRGGGGNFGVVTSFEYRLHPASMVTGGLVAHPLEKGREVLTYFRDLSPELPDEVILFGALVHAPDGSGAKLSAIVACDIRPPGTDDTVIEAIRSFGDPVMDAIQPMSYEAINTLMDAGNPRGAHNYWKTGLADRLPDEAIDTMVERFAAAPSPLDALVLEEFHGAVTRVPVDATAFPHREPGFNVGVIGQWVDSSLGDRSKAWATETFEAIEPHLSMGRYVNYLGEDSLPEELHGAYGPNLERLRRVKATYDSDNVFRSNQNIVPAEPGMAGGVV
jgi:FAD/FMN-containing dehydrogenase